MPNPLVDPVTELARSVLNNLMRFPELLFSSSPTKRLRPEAEPHFGERLGSFRLRTGTGPGARPADAAKPASESLCDVGTLRLNQRWQLGSRSSSCFLENGADYPKAATFLQSLLQIPTGSPDFARSHGWHPSSMPRLYAVYTLGWFST